MQKFYFTILRPDGVMTTLQLSVCGVAAECVGNSVYYNAVVSHDRQSKHIGMVRADRGVHGS